MAIDILSEVKKLGIDTSFKSELTPRLFKDVVKKYNLDDRGGCIGLSCCLAYAYYESLCRYEMYNSNRMSSEAASSRSMFLKRAKFGDGLDAKDPEPVYAYKPNKYRKHPPIINQERSYFPLFELNKNPHYDEAVHFMKLYKFVSALNNKYIAFILPFLSPAITYFLLELDKFKDIEYSPLRNLVVLAIMGAELILLLIRLLLRCIIAGGIYDYELKKVKEIEKLADYRVVCIDIERIVKCMFEKGCNSILPYPAYMRNSHIIDRIYKGLADYTGDLKDFPTYSLCEDLYKEYPEHNVPSVPIINYTGKPYRAPSVPLASTGKLRATPVQYSSFSDSGNNNFVPSWMDSSPSNNNSSAQKDYFYTKVAFGEDVDKAYWESKVLYPDDN